MKWADRIGRRVKVRDLHVLLAVAQSGSMARAADHLAISQPVISKTISDLEHALGARLLDRTSQGVEPTAYGRAFIDCGIAVFDELRRGVQQIEFLSDPSVGEVRIGGAGPLVDELIPATIARLASRYPQGAAVLANGTSTVALVPASLGIPISRDASSMTTAVASSRQMFPASTLDHSRWRPDRSPTKH